MENSSNQGLLPARSSRLTDRGGRAAGRGFQGRCRAAAETRRMAWIDAGEKPNSSENTGQNTPVGSAAWASPCRFCAGLCWVCSPDTTASSRRQLGEVVPRDVRECTIAACNTSPRPRPSRATGQAEEQEARVPGMGLMFPRLGRGPEFGTIATTSAGRCALYHGAGRHHRHHGQSMYHHGFAMLGLAEAYGAVDERNLWPDRKGPRSIGQALELAVRAAVTRKEKIAEAVIFARCQRRRHLRQRRRPRWPARRPERRDRSPRRVDRQGDRLLKLMTLRPDRSATPAASAGSANRSPAARSPPSSTPWHAARTSSTRRPSTTSSAARAARPQQYPNTPAITSPRRCSRAISTPGRNGTSS